MSATPRPSILFQKRPYEWVFSFLIGGTFLWEAISSWGEKTPIANFREGWWVIAGALIFMVFSLSMQKSFTRSWRAAAQLPGADAPRDEREWRLFERASSYSMTVMYLLVWGVAIALFFVPPPQGFALSYLLFALVTFQFGFRGLIAWALGIR